MSLRYLGGLRKIEARKGQQHQSLRGGLKGRGPQEKILWQQITDRLARTIEEGARNSRRVRRFIHPGKTRQGEKIFVYLEKEIVLDSKMIGSNMKEVRRYKISLVT